MDELLKLTVQFSDPFALLRDEQKRRRSPHSLPPDEILQDAADTFQDLVLERGFARCRVAKPLAEFVRKLVGADVAFLRELETDELLRLVEDQGNVAWGVDPIGTVPLRKVIGDGPCNNLAEVSGGDRTDHHESRCLTRLDDFYTESNRTFMRWLGSEAWIPIKFDGKTLAVLLVAKQQKSFFTPNKLKLLKQYQGFAQAFYHLATATDDRLESINLIRQVAGIITRFTEAPSRDAFCRAICALLTAQHGFRFDRAMVFWMENAGLPAESGPAATKLLFLQELPT